MVTEGVSKPENVTKPPVFGVEKSEKRILEAGKPCFTPENADFWAFTAHFKAFRGSKKWGHLGRKIDFFSFDQESDS